MCDRGPGFRIFREFQAGRPLYAQISFLRLVALVRRGDVESAVQAIKHGAADCVEKPVDAETFKTAVARVLDSGGAVRIPPEESLTRMEHIVFAGILDGKTTRAIALGMHRSPRMIEVHRKHIKRTLGAVTLTDLVVLATSGLEYRRNRAAEWGPIL